MSVGKRWLGNGVRVAVLAICVVSMFASITGAQVRPPVGQPQPIPQPPRYQPPMPPPFQPPPMPKPPPFQPPVVNPPRFNPPPMNAPQMEWYCTLCRGVLSRGGPKPVHITTCPHCGARFGPGGGFNNAPINAPNQGQPFDPMLRQGNPRPGGNADNSSSAARIIVGAIVGVIALLFVAACVIVGLVLVFKSSGASKPTKKPRRSRDSVHDY